MPLFPESTSNEPSIHGALELSKNRWLLALHAPGRDNPRLHPIKGGDAEGLMAKLEAASLRVTRRARRVKTDRIDVESMLTLEDA